ncbi:protein of unknown function [Paenibacillus sp. UNC496MF]|uniref:YjgB family protein n=1 Tax=Paenibacillus sp. UNC496MF TaxID=1502753 RepID=UPI0008E3CB4D|nr:YjgB family protein [Paenibacillus sp. UNC496MF]SFJ58475.1 protein of unknown function [Paenibacillus sp. UNC496MF]
MKNKLSAKNITAACLISGAAILGIVGITNSLTPAYASTQATISTAAPSKAPQTVNSFLNSFYKPALKGQFPEDIGKLTKGFTIGKTTRQEVIKIFGQGIQVGTGANAFDVYEGSMGQPGLSFSYKSDKLQEMRYFGTGMERQHNLGGITPNILMKQWGVPNSATTIKAGKTAQKKLVYIRGNYQLEFIFDNNTDLSHVNLTYKGAK